MPQSRRRVETQILHTDGKYWKGYTYAWNDAQTDAELVPADGSERKQARGDDCFSHGIPPWIAVFSFYRSSLSGPVNLAAPAPVPNRELMWLFREICGAPVGLPASRWMLELGAFFLRTETELIIKSRRVIPGRLLESGFQFQFAKPEEALRDVELRVDRKRTGVKSE